MDYKKLPWIAGNPLRLQIPLQIVTITADGSVTEDYEPQEGDTVTVILRSKRSEKIYNPDIEGNIATIEDNGQLLIGEYAVETLVVEAGGTKRRSYYPCVLNVMKATPGMLAYFDDFPEYSNGVLLDTPSIFFAVGSGGTIDAYTKEESDARYVQKVEMDNYYTKSQMLVVLLQYASRDYVDEKAAFLQNAIDLIEAVIPSAASSSNQLADKNFVNSSISTNTATFVGTYNSLAELQAVTGATNNDYGFVIETDALGNEYYDRYKYNGSQWLFEYKVESTPFTAAQWAAIQSGITSNLVTKLTALPTSAAVNEAIAVAAKDSDSTHLVDFCDPDGNLLFYIGTDFTFHAIGNNDSEGEDWEIPCLGLVKYLIEEAIEGIQPSTEGGIEVMDGDNDHVLDVCDEDGYLLFYVDADYTLHTVMSSSSFHLPDTINTYVGDTLQMFYYPTFLDRDFRNIGVNMFVQGEPLRGKSFERYSEYSPSTAGTKTMICTALDKDLGIVATKTVTVNVVSPSSPSSMKNILLIGDSETEGYVNNSTVSPSADGQTTAMRYSYATEMQRILTSSDAATATAPAGLGLSNIQLIGTAHAGGIRHEGYGGRTTAWFMGTASPFYINGSINFNAYLGQDSIYSDTSKKGVDYIYILLGANDGVQTTVMGNRLVLTADTYKSSMIALLNAIKTQIVSSSGAYANPNLKVILLSYVICNPTGGAYHVLGQGQYDNGMKQALSYYKFHEVCDEIAAMDEFSSFVESVYISPQIDSEHAYAYINKQVNSYSEETEKVYVENIHPNTIGYKMYGHAVARDFLSRI